MVPSGSKFLAPTQTHAFIAIKQLNQVHFDFPNSLIK